MTFEEVKDKIRRILTHSYFIGSWELEDIMDALDITPCDISTCKVAKALWGNKGNLPDIDISRVKNDTSLEAQPTDADCISRQAVLDYAKDTCLDLDKYEDTEAFCDEIKAMPPVTPTSEDIKEAYLKGYDYGVKDWFKSKTQLKIGRWMRKTKVDGVYDIAGVKTWGVKCQCDRCDFATTVIEDFGYYKYCPNCGAEMSGGEEDEVSD